MRAAVLINPGAGAAAEGVQVDKLESLFAAQGINAEARVLSNGDLGKAVEEALARKPDAVVVAGGDGTINAVASRLAGTGIPLGVLPMGTYNHFAKDLGLPLEIGDAIKLIRPERIKAVDVGEVNGHVFINNSSLGAYPRMVEEREQTLRKFSLPKRFANFVAFLKVLKRWPLINVKLDIDGQRIVRTTPFVFVGNNEYTMNLFKVSLRSGLDRGALWIYTVKTTSFIGLLRLFWRSLINRLEQSRNFESYAASEFKVVPHRHHVRVSLDGEVVRMQTPLHYRIRPRDLRVFAP
ncbi:MAG TPA: diacylglycerol kinase family protein [Verrucomicrobiae bacterium]|nr:diacylglycerol kinase family protein [Verrucomicrobiae bacterium]